MSSHLSDEAVAAFADGVLRGAARTRAAHHVETCAECRQAVRSQREAVFALRAAPTPALPAGLFERLQALPSVTPVSPLPTVTDEDGSMLLAAGPAPVAAIIPQAPVPAKKRGKSHGPRSHPFATGVAVVALAAGALAVSSVAGSDDATSGVNRGTDAGGHATVASDHQVATTPSAYMNALFAGR